ncbi:MAG: hypothetical protein BA869_07385 [Desulfuromonadales bacterium C00003107]|nr:MAG: hypothetical protein BA869_07385 [Desulfuromonadales bacterium C00003107]
MGSDQVRLWSARGSAKARGKGAGFLVDKFDKVDTSSQGHARHASISPAVFLRDAAQKIAWLQGLWVRALTT